MKTIIETERLVLREIVLEDCREVFNLHANPMVQKFTGEPVVESMWEIEMGMKENTFKDYSNYGYGRWATILKSENKLIGWAGLKYLPEFDKVDLGYRLSPEYWGYGYATEASIGIVDFGFETLGLQRIIAVAMKENKASIRVMEKAGMKFDKFAPYEMGGKDVAWYVIDNVKNT